jgi:hypothetical protein
VIKKQYVIIGIIITVAAIIAVLAAAYSQGIIGREPFVKIAINGLKESYKANEPISFSATIEGYGKPCGEIEGKILGATSAGSNITIGPWTQVPNCVANQPNTSFTHKFPLENNSINTSVNQTGTYKLVIIFRELPSNKESQAQQEFAVIP